MGASSTRNIPHQITQDFNCAHTLGTFPTKKTTTTIGYTGVKMCTYFGNIPDHEYLQNRLHRTQPCIHFENILVTNYIELQRCTHFGNISNWKHPHSIYSLWKHPYSAYSLWEYPCSYYIHDLIGIKLPSQTDMRLNFLLSP